MATNCTACLRTYVHLPHAAGCEKAEGSLIPCPRCGGDGYYETGDFFNGSCLEAGARNCELCSRNGDDASTSIFRAEGTGRLALPIAPAVLALLDDEGEDHLTDLYTVPPECFECNDDGYVPALWFHFGPRIRHEGRSVIACSCERGEHFGAETLRDLTDECGFDPRMLRRALRGR